MSEQKSPEIHLRLTHNLFFEETFRMPSLAKAFLRHFLPPEMLGWLDIENLTVETAKFCDEQFRETRPDMVYTVPIRGAEGFVRFHVILEHKSYNDRSAIFQIWKYIEQICVQEVVARLTDPKTKKHKAWPKDFWLSPIIPIILHHGIFPFSGEIELAKLFYPLTGAEEFLPHQKAILVDLTKIEDDDLPHDETAPELHAVLVIMKVIFSKSITKIRRKFSEVLEELKAYAQNPMYRKLIYQLRHYVIRNAKNITKEDFFEIKTEVGRVIEEGDSNMSSFVQDIINEGMVKGIAVGRAEGEAKNEARAILRILARRFRKVPKRLEARIFTITDLACLEKLFDLAFDCESLVEFAESMK